MSEVVIFVPMLKSHADEKGYSYVATQQMIDYEVAQALEKKTDE